MFINIRVFWFGIFLWYVQKRYFYFACWQSTQNTYRHLFKDIFGVFCQCTNNGVTECSVSISKVKLQNDLAKKVLCELLQIIEFIVSFLGVLIKYSVDKYKTELQSTLYVHFTIVHRVHCKSHTEWMLSCVGSQC